MEEDSVKTDDDIESHPLANQPADHDFKFSFRRLWQFAGPGLLMSIAYLDPGNSKILMVK